MGSKYYFAFHFLTLDDKHNAEKNIQQVKCFNLIISAKISPGMIPVQK